MFSSDTMAGVTISGRNHDLLMPLMGVPPTGNVRATLLRRAVLKVKGRALTATALLVAACSQSPQQVVTGTSHCTEVKLTSNLMMRLSSYKGYPDSITLWVVQACHPTGTVCSPILTYDHAPPPVYSLNGNTVTVNLLGGRDPSVHHEQAKIGSSVYAFRAHVMTGDVGQTGVRAFRSGVQHRCPASNQQYPRSA